MRSVCYLEVLLTGRPDSGVLCTWMGLLILARLLVVLWRLWQPKGFPEARPEVQPRIELEDQNQKARKICASMGAPPRKLYVTRGTDTAVLKGRVSRICLYFLKQMFLSSIYCGVCFMFELRKISLNETFLSIDHPFELCCSVYLFCVIYCLPRACLPSFGCRSACSPSPIPCRLLTVYSKIRRNVKKSSIFYHF